jgi:hypothetical protein
MLDAEIFSSITAFNTLSAKEVASTNVKDLWNCSCNSVCAPSDPEPIAFASYWVRVPEGSA